MAGLSFVFVLSGCIELPQEVPNSLPPDYVPAASGQTGITIGDPKSELCIGSITLSNVIS